MSVTPQIPVTDLKFPVESKLMILKFNGERFPGLRIDDCMSILKPMLKSRQFHVLCRIKILMNRIDQMVHTLHLVIILECHLN